MDISTIISSLDSATTPAEYSAGITKLGAAFAALDDAAKASPEAAQAAATLAAYYAKPAPAAPAAVAVAKPPVSVTHGGKRYNVTQPVVLTDDRGRKAVAVTSEDEARRMAARLLAPEMFAAATTPTEEEVAFALASVAASQAVREAAARGAILLPEAEGRPWWHYALAGLGLAAVAGGCWYFYQQHRDSQSPQAI